MFFWYGFSIQSFTYNVSPHKVLNARPQRFYKVFIAHNKFLQITLFFYREHKASIRASKPHQRFLVIHAPNFAKPMSERCCFLVGTFLTLPKFKGIMLTFLNHSIFFNAFTYISLIYLIWKLILHKLIFLNKLLNCLVWRAIPLWRTIV